MATATVSKNSENDSPAVNIMPPMVFYGCLLLGGAFEFFIPSDFPVFSKLMRIGLGLVLGGGGFIFMTIAHATFKRIGTNVPTNLPATTFVVQGIYKISRNPMYLGGSAFFWGIGIAIGSIWILLAYIPLGLYLSLYVIPHEEAYMQRTFKDKYSNYCREVKRWL